MRAASRRSSRPVSSKSVPRETLTTIAPVGRRSSTSRVTTPTVSRVCGAAITRQSLSAARRPRSPGPPTQRTPGGPPRSGRRRTPATLMPSPSARRATAPPIPPSPKTPTRNSPNSRTGIARSANSTLAHRSATWNSRNRSRPRAKYASAAIAQSAIGSACTAAEFVSTTPAPLRCGRLAPIPAVPLWAHLRVPRRSPPAFRSRRPRPTPPARAPRPLPTPRPGRPESPAPRTAGPARRPAARRGPRPGVSSLSGGDGSHAGVMEQRNHHLVVKPLRPPQREVDHQIDVLAATGLALDLEPGAAHQRLEILHDGRVRTSVNGEHALRGLSLDQQLDPPESSEHEQDQQRRAGRFPVECGAEGDADRRDHPDRRGAGQAHDRAAGVEDRAGADEADTGDDLGGHARRVGIPGSHRDRQLRVQHGADADEDVRSQASRLAPQLSLQANGPAEQRREAELEEQLQPEHLDHLLDEVLHQASPVSSRPMQRRTWVIVSRASTRAFAAPARRVALTLSGSARSACARSRMGVSAAIILSASTRLQSRHPQPAVRQLWATRAWVSGLEKPWWMVKMLQMSGLPGSFRVTRAGSVAAGLSFSQMVSGESNKPMVFPKLLDIFARPSSPRTRFAVDRSACGSGKAKPPLFAKRAFQRRAISRISSRCWSWSSPTGTSVAR